MVARHIPAGAEHKHQPLPLRRAVWLPARGWGVVVCLSNDMAAEEPACGHRMAPPCARCAGAFVAMVLSFLVAAIVPLNVRPEPVLNLTLPDGSVLVVPDQQLMHAMVPDGQMACPTGGCLRPRGEVCTAAVAEHRF